MAENNTNPEYLSNIIAITREQLNRAMGVSAELEAALHLERRRVQELEAQVADLSKKPVKE